ncbi:MAG: fluoride efflux transporter CrcB, partial [Gemmatimonadales bacterium]|nr:fluoride efflux transporter CrcB [Gemmatimonadales bacterium]NIP08242.1 fluoride efflux transporter CrcB [Gemmatimonadales bacterium]
MQTLAWIAAGGAVGALMRYGVSFASTGRVEFPVGTVLANVSGALVLGFLAAWLG